MGDRALVIFKELVAVGANSALASSGLSTVKKDSYSPVIYLHSHGYAVPELLSDTRQVMVGREGDVEYTAARFVGVCHKIITGNLSLGIWNLPSDFKQTKKYLEEMSHGDAGVIIVNINTWKFKQYGGYKLEQLAPLTNVTNDKEKNNVWT
jgi:hypothetical protein